VKKTGKIDGCFKIGAKIKLGPYTFQMISFRSLLLKKNICQKLHFLLPSLRENREHR